VNRALRRISIAVLVMFLLLLVNVNYLQGFEPASLATKPGNSRAFYATQNQYERGSIITSDNVTIAGSKPSSNPDDSIKYQRSYPLGEEYAPVTGYDTLYSQTGIEAAENSLLSGNDSALDVRKIIDLITGKTTKGATVQVTINSAAQNAAWQALEAAGKPGGVVAIDPSTGKILAMASYPSYNPDLLATHDSTQLVKVDDELLRAAGNPLLNRATQATYPPGSTFKIVTSSTLLTQDPSTTINTSVASPTDLTLPQTTHVLTNDDGEACGNGSGQAPLITAFAQSCDTTFGKIGLDLGGSALNAMAEKFGLNDVNLTVPLSVTPSNYTIPASLPLTAYSAIGQFDDTVTPLQEAMFAAAIANGGTLMKPYLVQQVTASDLSTVTATTPSVLSQPVSSSVASDVQQMMRAVVQDPDGTAYTYNAQAVDGIVIAGKTGTAQNGANNTGLDDAAFTCFAPYGNPKIAVGVIIQGGGYGAIAAAPIAVQVIKAYLATLGIK
jgi:peptidoglycan glycosyltransferase